MTTVLERTVGEIIESALREATIIPAEQTVNAVDYSRGIIALNDLLKEWQSSRRLWELKYAVLPLVPGQTTYDLGPTGDNCGEADTFYTTTLGAAASASDTVITVASSTNMVAAPNILTSDPTDSTQDWTAVNSATISQSSGIVITNVGGVAGGAEYTLDTTQGKTYRVRFAYTKGTATGATFSVLNGTTSADSVSLTSSGADNELIITAASDSITFKFVNNSSTTGHTSTVYDLEYVDEESGSYIGIELSDGTMDWGRVLNVNSATSIDLASGISGAAASGATVYFYTTQISRPILVDNMMYAVNFTASENIVQKWSRSDYFEQPSKTNAGSVNSAYFQPTRTNAQLRVWPTASTVKNLLRFTYQEAMTAYSLASETLEVTEEYYNAVKWQLAADLSPGYGLPADRQAAIQARASAKLEEAEDHDAETAPMTIEPDFS